MFRHIPASQVCATYDASACFRAQIVPLRQVANLQDALDHAHRHEVIHRNLTLDAILVTKGGQARVTAFDYARVGKNRTSTIADQIVDDLDPFYQAPECDRDTTRIPPSVSQEFLDTLLRRHTNQETLELAYDMIQFHESTVRIHSHTPHPHSS